MQKKDEFTAAGDPKDKRRARFGRRKNHAIQANLKHKETLPKGHRPVRRTRRGDTYDEVEAFRADQQQRSTVLQRTLDCIMGDDLVSCDAVPVRGHHLVVRSSAVA